MPVAEICRKAGISQATYFNWRTMENFFSSLKTERTARKLYLTWNDAKADGLDYIERFCNPKRRHSTLGYLSPNDFETRARLA